jgi:signal transduction histidine kinase
LGLAAFEALAPVNFFESAAKPKSLKKLVSAIGWFSLIQTQPFFPQRVHRTEQIVRTCLVLSLLFCGFIGHSQTTNTDASLNPKRVLMIFSEARDLPGNVLMEQAVRQEMQAHSSNYLEFFTESLDAGHFSDLNHYSFFGDYIREKYQGQHIDLVIMFMSRNFLLAQEMNAALSTNIPSIFVVLNDLNVTNSPGGRPFTGIFQRFDIPGTVKFIFRTQPETRHVVVVGGVSPADQATAGRISEMARSVAGVKFEFWTNLPVSVVCEDAQSLPPDTVILLGTVQRDVTGQAFYTSQVVPKLAQLASVPVYVLGEGLIGTGALGGNVMDSESLGTDTGNLALRVLAGTPVSDIPVEVRTNGTPMVDWRQVLRWRIKQGRLPSDSVLLYRPTSLWQEHKVLILFVAAGLFAQAITIVGLLVQRRQKSRAEAEIERQRIELVYVTRVSTMGQLASALTHELNQPLGAILRNAEAAELFLQSDPPNLEEIRAILTDIRRDDKRAGNVIDRMRALYKRRSVTTTRVDMRELVEDTIALTRAEAAAKHVRLAVHLPAALPYAQGDRVHLQQVLLNLILNGMDAMLALPQPRRSLSVRALETKNGNLQVDVADQGTGMAPEVAARIFEPFFTTKTNGMGMGLAISQTIIEAHGGDIWVESKMVQGATFRFILPPAGLSKVKDGDLPSVF